MLPKSISLALSSLLAFSCAETKGEAMAPVVQATEAARASSRAHLATDSRLRDLLNHPAFAGFGHLILPWDNRRYDGNLALSDLGTLLPYHSHIRPGIMV